MRRKKRKRLKGNFRDRGGKKKEEGSPLAITRGGGEKEKETVSKLHFPAKMEGVERGSEGKGKREGEQKNKH